MRVDKQSNLLVVSGVLLILLSFFVNISSVGKFVAQDGRIDNLLIMNYFWVFRLFLFLSGCVLIFNKLYLDKIISLKKELLVFAVSVFVCLMVLEFTSFLILKYNFGELAFRNKMMHYDNFEYNITAIFNSFGFRDIEFDVKNNSVIVVGDSMVFGDGVGQNDTFVSLLNKKVSADSFVVYNLGVSGTYPTDYLRILKNMLPVLKPKFVIVGLTLENDIVCSEDGVVQEVFFPNLRVLARKIYEWHTSKSDVQFLIDKSNLPNVYKTYLRNDLVSSGIIRPLIYSKNVTRRYVQFNDWFNSCGVNKKILTRIGETIHRGGSELLFLIIPPSFQVSDRSVQSLSNIGYDVDGSLLVRRELEDNILQFCKASNLSCIDLLPYLRASNKSPFFDVDIHLNTYGHSLVAQIVEKFFKQQIASNGTTR